MKSKIISFIALALLSCTTLSANDQTSCAFVSPEYNDTPECLQFSFFADALRSGKPKVAVQLIQNDPSYFKGIRASSGMTNLILAVTYDKTAQVAKSLIEDAGFNPDQVHINHNSYATPLIQAVVHDNLEAVKLLLSYDVDINRVVQFSNSSQDRLHRKSALSMAIRFKHLDIIKLLLAQEELDVNSIVYLSCTPLTQAIGGNNEGHSEEIVMLLLHDKRIDINKADGYTNTPLMEAVLTGRLNIVRQLLKYENIDLEHRHSNGQNALDFAIENATRWQQLDQEYLQRRVVDLERMKTALLIKQALIDKIYGAAKDFI